MLLLLFRVSLNYVCKLKLHNQTFHVHDKTSYAAGESCVVLSKTLHRFMRIAKLKNLWNE